MKLTYDPRYNIAYLRFHEKAGTVETIHVSDELNVDLAPDGTISRSPLPFRSSNPKSQIKNLK